MQTSADVVADEMATFKLEKNVDGLSVLEWWKLNGRKYHNMAVTARRILAVRATSSEAERDFSVAG